MRWKRPLITLGLLVTFVGGYLFAEKAAELYLWQAFESGSYIYDVLFETLTWVLPATIAGGLFFGAIHAAYSDPEPTIREGLVRRHEAFGAFFEHWAATVGMLFLIGSGVLLGFLFVPRFVSTTETVGLTINVHWAGAAILLFAASYHLGGLIMGDHREILPKSGDLKNAVRNVASYLRLGNEPEAEKYLPIQRVSYLIWAGLIAVVAITGLVKAADYPWEVGGGLMSAMTYLHDIFALFTILFLVAHVGAVLMPSHLQQLRSQITGWIPIEYVRSHHSRWLPEQTGSNKSKSGGD
ncbi:MAG: cytochrome b/b6 domain-containing protein [Halodesulfurarchaeum sp.]